MKVSVGVRKVSDDIKKLPNGVRKVSDGVRKVSYGVRMMPGRCWKLSNKSKKSLNHPTLYHNANILLYTLGSSHNSLHTINRLLQTAHI